MDILELFTIKRINLLSPQQKRLITADFVWRHYPNKAHEEEERGGSRGLPAYKPPPSTTLSLPRGLPRCRSGETQSALRSFAGKRLEIQLDPRGHTIIDHMPS
ncbi:hypothetical protein ILYODFUR_025539 [Ilyodon furcidens]|uniref:Uncharacterized protein n=1 Tax=Ilyodon furcidens TaxID=33524 RepID=A0ABV0VH38_9TELE